MGERTILQKLYRVHTFLAELESAPRDFGSGELLYASSVHTLEVVAKEPGVSLTGVASALEVSTAAVSKFIAKLVRGGYLVKSAKPGNRKELAFFLTAKGETAVAGHRRFMESALAPYRQLEAALPDDQYAVIDSFLERMLEAAE